MSIRPWVPIDQECLKINSAIIASHWLAICKSYANPKKKDENTPPSEDHQEHANKILVTYMY
jgi:hypothetical protein